MGEYAKLISDGERIKIGTCEQMYYLRADQVHLIAPDSHRVNPRLKSQAEHIRFRFPFPQEDGMEPGAFADFDYGLGISGVEPPEDIDHGFLQFTRNYPQSGGINLSIPCPRGKEGKASPIKVRYNGYSGPVQIHSQKLLSNGVLCLILRCADCGALYRLETLEECQPILLALRSMSHSPEYWQEIANRIEAGYTKRNFWADPAELATA